MKGLISYFIKRPVVANTVMFGLIAIAGLTWTQIGKEEMPEFAMEFVRINIRYPGASAEDVELFISKPIEEKLKGVSGLEEVQNTAAYGSSSFYVAFEPRISNLQEKIQEVKDAVESVQLPREADDPVYSQFRSSEKAIIDIGIYLEGEEILDVPARIKLQEYVLAFQNKVLSLPEISGFEASGYLRRELQVKVRPQELARHELAMNQVKAQILEKHVRRPVGSLKNQEESDVTVLSELDNVDALEELIVSGSFQGNIVKLGQVAKVEDGFERNSTVVKVQGHEGVILNLKKSSRTDIISAQQAVLSFIDNFSKGVEGDSVRIIIMDDESSDVRNRLNLVSTNGLVGFLLIVIVLFLSLDLRTGIWVALGIPFSLAFTLVMAHLFGYTVNNMTLAAIIVVLGIVVDDAIIVAENISRGKEDGTQSTLEATSSVVAPIMASVLTTCAAFIPLYFFSGRFGLFVKYIPTIIIFMLVASLFESFFILPSHMEQSLTRKKKKNFAWMNALESKRLASLRRLEAIYTQVLAGVLKHRTSTFLVFFIFLGGASYLYQNKLKYVMFPREESTDFRVKVEVPQGSSRYQTARKIREVENVFLSSPHVTNLRSSVGESRRGGEVRDNEASLRVEITDPTERDESLGMLFQAWEEQFAQLEGFDEIRLQRSRFGSDSGSPIAIEVQENNDERRQKLMERLQAELVKIKGLTNVEIERPITKREYSLHIDREEASRLGIAYDDIASVLRSYVEGDVLYTLNSTEEEVDVRFTSIDQSKNSIEDLTSLSVSNQDGYLVPLNAIVKVKEGRKPSNIQRVNFKRTSSLFADIVEGSGATPLDIADLLEREIFPKVTQGFPGANIVFRGEIQDSRESQSDFTLSIILVLAIIYVLLVFLFDSIWKPFIIGAIIPFGVVGAIYAFWIHGMTQYGFFAVVGTLGMIGVVINDSIVMLDKFQSSVEWENVEFKKILEQISKASALRLRAVVVTTVTTVIGLVPTAYGIGGYDSMLAEMMLAMAWGLSFGMLITLFLVPCVYSYYLQISIFLKRSL